MNVVLVLFMINMMLKNSPKRTKEKKKKKIEQKNKRKLNTNIT